MIIKEEGVIEFGKWLTGHDEETVKQLFDDFNNYKQRDESVPVEKLVMPKIYGVVEWVNKNPILDGMQSFRSKEMALKYCEGRLSGAIKLPNETVLVKHTIIEINFSV